MEEIQAASISLFSSPVITGGALLLVFGALCGYGIAHLRYRSALRKARSVITTFRSAERAISPVKVPTGVHDVDSILGLYTESVRSLLEVVSSVESQTEALLERYRIMTDNIAAAIFVRNSEGVFTFISPFTEVLTGYSLKEISESQEDFFSSIVHEGDGEIYARLQQFSALGEAFQARYRIYHKTGLEIWVETRNVPILDDQGEVAGSLAASIDITASVLHQREIEERNRDLQDFTFMVSHDLKAPIYTIKGMSALLREEISSRLDQEHQEMLTHISEAAERLEKLVASVVEYSRVSSLESSQDQVDLNKVLEEVRADLQAQIAQSDAIVEIPGEIPRVLGDEIKLYQIFSNLIGNAIKYRSPERAPQVSISIQPQRRDYDLAIAISDNGLGIPADKLQHIFRPFQRVHPGVAEGHGIGLASVKRLLEKIGGSIKVESEEGKGSVFTLTLRRSRSSSSESVEGIS